MLDGNRGPRGWWAAALALALSVSVPAAAQRRATEPEPARATSIPERAPGADYLRPFLFDAAMLLGGTIWYWLDDRNIVDWDYDSWEQRFDEDAYRFDNNEFPINYIGHPLSGAAYYGVPRANRMHWLPAFGYALVTSFVWEFFLEFQERFSLNDFVATPLGGVPIGEGFVRLGRWLDRTAHPALAWTLGFPVALFEAMDGRQVGRESGPPDEDPGWARVMVDAGFAWAVPGGDAAGPGFDVTRVGAEAAFVALPGYREPGMSARPFLDAEVTRLRMTALVSSQGAGFELDADTILAGAHLRAIRADGEGIDVVLGTSVSHYYRFENYDPWNDRLAYTGFPGLATQAVERHGPVAWSIDARLQPIFGGSSASNDLARWTAQNPDGRPKSLLVRHGYWNGWGWTARGRVALELGALTLAADLHYVAMDSQEGYDRNEGNVTGDADGWGELLETTLEARIALPAHLMLRGRWTGQGRVSALDDVSTERRLDRWELAFGAQF